MNGRTKFVVTSMAIMFVVSWTMSLGRLFADPFWNPQRATRHSSSADSEGDDNTTSSSPIQKIGLSYYSSRRYAFFLPHVVGAVLWWNLSFFQLVPSIRHKYKWFHRNLGRLLMVTALAQIISGLGLACTSHSTTIKLVSFFLALAVTYCLGFAFYYAVNRDIPKHKFWVLRLVGYMQTIVLQRFWLFVLILLRQFGLNILVDSQSSVVDTKDDPSSGDIISYEMFDQSFIMAILTAWLVTEWYLSAELLGMVEPPAKPVANKDDRRREKEQSPATIPHPEERPLL